MNLSIEDLEAIKAIVREVVRDELQRLEHRQVLRKPEQLNPQLPGDAKRGARPEEIVAHIRRASAA